MGKIVHNTEVEEEECYDKCNQKPYDYDFHRNIPLCPYALFGLAALFPFQFLCGKPECGFDNAGGFDNADYSGNRNAANADMPCIRCENLVCAHGPYCLCKSCPHKVKHLPVEKNSHQWNDTEPYEE